MDNSVTTPAVKRLADYQPYGFEIERVSLTFELEPERTKVTNVMQVKKVENSQSVLILDGIAIDLVSVHKNGSAFSGYVKGSDTLSIDIPEDNAEITLVTSCNPSANTSLEGLYVAGSAFCTQCEAEGFRKITYFPDRPDVMSTFNVKIIADKGQYPFLLCNGNKTAEGELADGNHWVTWQDPHKKPCYLFALVAGDFDLVTDTFITASGRDVALQLYVDKGNAHRGQHALNSLKKSMTWDEETFGLEYDLDIYMIVAVDFFNMGAMENKGLNVFNSKYVLADAESATDEDYFNIESIIAHEYFHNWTGNRVTCRDWFQLSLKEGLTVFRDQQFSADMSSPVSNRLKQVRVMREHQFAEDAGPMSHPIRPAEVIEMNNFYTVTVYDKGAEVIRMIHTLLGVDGFRKGMDLYFHRHDGQAVTCDDFVQAMQDASGVDLTLFRRWYSQSGTPTIHINKEYDQQQNRLTIHFEQCHPETADQKNKRPLHIPIAWEVFKKSSNQNIQLPPKSGVFNLTQQHQTLVIDDVAAAEGLAIFNNFSAPVKVQESSSFTDYLDIMLYASDGFSRWDAAQQVYSDLIWRLYDGESAADIRDVTDEIAKALASSEINDLGLLAELLSLPGIESLSEQRDVIAIDILYESLRTLKHQLACLLSDFSEQQYLQHHLAEYSYNTADAAKRRLRGICLSYLIESGRDAEIASQHFNNANNMTDKLAALRALQQQRTLDVFDELMTRFEETWRCDVLVLDKWFALHAGTDRKDVLARLDLLMSHQQFNFDNPNRVRSIVGTFAFYNVPHFHHVSGSGYQYLADNIIKLNKVNPQVASRIITPLLRWRKYDDLRSTAMRMQLMRIGDTVNLSKDLFEKISKSLTK